MLLLLHAFSRENYDHYFLLVFLSVSVAYKPIINHNDFIFTFNSHRAIKFWYQQSRDWKTRNLWVADKCLFLLAFTAVSALIPFFIKHENMVTTKLRFFVNRTDELLWGSDIWVLLAYFDGRKSDDAASQTIARVTGLQTLNLKWPSPLTEVIYLFMYLRKKQKKYPKEMNTQFQSLNVLSGQNID